MAVTPSLFNDIVLHSPETEGIKYAGSKLKLLPQILEMVKKSGAKTVLDGFAGTTRVAQALSQSGYQVFCNDLSAWSEVFGRCYLLNRAERSAYAELIDHLNGLSPVDGWFSEHYGGSVDSVVTKDQKRPWQLHNTRMLDAIRGEIDRLRLPPVEEAVAITSLILAMDRVDSTLGHFVSYLKDWSPRSFNQMKLEVPKTCANRLEHRVTRSNVFDAASSECDLAYFDPPYGSNNDKMPPSRVRYASYYHVWTTICLNDCPEVFGKANRRVDCSDTIAASEFEEFRKNPTSNRFYAIESIERLINKTKAQWVLLSYSSGGRATANELNEVLDANGIVREALEVDYRRNVMSGMRWTNDWVRNAEAPNREFLFLLEKY